MTIIISYECMHGAHNICGQVRGQDSLEFVCNCGCHVAKAQGKPWPKDADKPALSGDTT